MQAGRKYPPPRLYLVVESALLFRILLFPSFKFRFQGDCLRDIGFYKSVELCRHLSLFGRICRVQFGIQRCDVSRSSLDRLGCAV